MPDVLLIHLTEADWRFIEWLPWLPEAEQTALVYALLSRAGASCQGERSPC